MRNVVQLVVALDVMVLSVCSTRVFAQQTDPAYASQATLFVRFLGTVAANQDAHALIDTLMMSPGTRLVIAQQNLARRVSAAEYRETLLAFSERRRPELDYDRSDARAVKGAAGLTADVLPALQWGADHLQQLQSNLAAIEAIPVEEAASKLALDNLPQRVPLAVPLFIVMGGRAGAAATDSGIYYDALVTSVRSPTHMVDATQVTEFFAHELHHVGLGQIVDRKEKQLRLTANAARAYSLLSGLVMEGSASYLINGHRDLAAMQTDRTMTAPGTDAERMMSVQRVLSGLLDDAWTEAQYDDAMTQFVGNSLHRTGAALLDPIWRKNGRSAAMAVLRDPRQLLIRYNAAVAGQSSVLRFPAALANRVAEMGS